ncbi:universal stress protein [Xanthovirga aplysinae]|uniref:universal stress protein n=1 Tax=Xanthovirga aplysinae TaxID=2529853 RepID=UPI0012BD5A5F|nr:universal stress protein [Xanthovirga aplysinae]MTI31093.1 universal stress protein [Xanthovirga aplysinae]
MRTLKKILVPTDFSDCAQNASKIAIELARFIQAEVHFFHMVEAPLNWIKLEKEKEKNFPEVKAHIASARSKIQHLIEEAQKANVNAKENLSFNESPSEILKHIESQPFDLVIMGSHGAEGWPAEMLGSNTHKVIHQASVPVFVVKALPKQLSFKKIILAYDFKKETESPAIEKILNFSVWINAKVELLFINTPMDFRDTPSIHLAMEKVKEQYSDHIKGLHIFNYFNLEEGILEFCKYHHPDLIGMITHRQKSFKRLFSGSATEYIINHSPIPVLSLNLQ